jgi:hypothetical protein
MKAITLLEKVQGLAKNLGEELEKHDKRLEVERRDRPFGSGVYYHLGMSDAYKGVKELLDAFIEEENDANL